MNGQGRETVDALPDQERGFHRDHRDDRDFRDRRDSRDRRDFSPRRLQSEESEGTVATAASMVSVEGPPQPEPLSLVEQLTATAFALGCEHRGRGLKTHARAFKLAVRLQRIPGAITSVAADKTLLADAVAAYCKGIGDDLEHEQLKGWGSGPEGLEEASLDVGAAWGKVRAPGGPLAAAAYQADTAPITLLAPLDRSGPRFRRLAGMAYHLQRSRPGEAIQLPVWQVADLLATSHTRVRELLDRAMAAGLLRLVDGDYSRGKARDFKFDVACTLYEPPPSQSDGFGKSAQS